MEEKILLSAEENCLIAPAPYTIISSVQNDENTPSNGIGNCLWEVGQLAARSVEIREGNSCHSFAEAGTFSPSFYHGEAPRDLFFPQSFSLQNLTLKFSGDFHPHPRVSQKPLIQGFPFKVYRWFVSRKKNPVDRWEDIPGWPFKQGRYLMLCGVEI